MRWAVAVIALLVVGCHREPSFDERYEKAEKSIREKAAAIDAELAKRERLASEAAASPTASPAGRQAHSLMKAAK